MIYAFSVNGKMLLFSGIIEPENYEMIEKIASETLDKTCGSTTSTLVDRLKDALDNAGFSLSHVTIEKVFRPRKNKGFVD